ncbi:type I methionyl aminopeptidase [Candidatus Daviesbacteria bacterium]|nr:type I methionyl aminopeptidase [Candidatus Daviesbacteria bacterium]
MSLVKPRSQKELKLMRLSGQISAKALKKALKSAKSGVSLLEIEDVAASEIKKNGAKLSFLSAPGYKWATCLTVNDELVHGIPRDIKLKDGDLLSIDVGALFEGWHTDTAWSIIVGQEKDKEQLKEKTRFLKVGEKALWTGINQAVAGNTVGDISNAIQTVVEKAGYSISKTLIGHGVGKALHEKPDIPGYGQRGVGLILEEGMTLAIEVIYAAKNADVYLSDDGWTYTTKDGSLGGLFEMSVIVGKDKAEVITDWRKV